MAKQSWNNPPEMEIDIQKDYTAVVKTSEGDISLELFARDAPKTVNNFIFLARQGYYGDVIFHRVTQWVHDPDGQTLQAPVRVVRGTSSRMNRCAGRTPRVRLPWPMLDRTPMGASFSSCTATGWHCPPITRFLARSRMGSTWLMPLPPPPRSQVARARNQRTHRA